MKKLVNKAASLAIAAVMVTAEIPAQNVIMASTEDAEKYTVNMNVSYHDFYSMFGVDTTANVTTENYIDAVSSATKTKPYNTGLNPSVYVTGNAETDNVVYIEGVNIPVEVSAEERQVLIDAGIYQTEDFNAVSEQNKAYFDAEILDATKLVASDAISTEAVTLSAIYGTATTLSDVEAGYTTISQYGDYEFALSGKDITDIIENTIPYGVIVNTAEGDQYALYSQENIWRISDLSWSAGVVTTTHNCELRSEVYAKSVGQTVTSFTYITNEGLYTVDIPDTKLVDINAVKDTKVTAEAGDLEEITDVTVTLTDIPENYQPSFTYKASSKGAKEQETLSAIKNADGTYNVKIADLLPGSYVLVVSDASLQYAQKSVTFTVAGSPVSASGTLITLNPAKGKDSIENYVNNITKVTVKKEGEAEVEYLPSKNGMGTIQVASIVNKDGSINTDASYTRYTSSGSGKNVTYTEAGSGKVFVAGDYTVVITAKNYESVTTIVKVEASEVTQTPGTSAAPEGTQAPGTSAAPTGTQIPAASVAPTGTATAGAIATVQPTAQPEETVAVAKAQKLTIKTANKTIKVADLKKKAQTFKITASAKTQVNFAKVSGNKKITVNKAGKVKVAKGLKKGTYKLKIKATAVKTATYKKTTLNKTIKIVVK